MTRSLISPKHLFSALFALVLFGLLGEAQAATFSGKWNNRKFGTEGVLVAILTPSKNSTWSGRFTGRALGKPFAYTTQLTATQGKGRIELKGTSNVDGDTYTWTAYIQRGMLSGRYTASNGNNGNFSGRQQKR